MSVLEWPEPTDQTLLLETSSHGKVPSIFRNTQMIPAYCALLSAVTIILHIIIVSDPVQRLFARLRSKEFEPIQQHPVQEVEQPNSLFGQLKYQIRIRGGWSVVSFYVARLVGCLVLLGLFITMLVWEEINDDSNGASMFKKKHKKKKQARYPFTYQEWIDIAMCSTFLYLSLLALISVVSKSRTSKTVIGHLNTILVVTLGVYTYRDIYPLLTYTLPAQDASEGWIIWTKLAFLTFVGAIIPLCVPRQYAPVDPSNPSIESGPEQTASIFSLAVYSFLDSTIWMAYKVPHLSWEQLPSLCDYDYAENLKARAFKHVDVFTSGNRGHIFFSLMTVFRTEYITLSFMIILQSIFSFGSPIGIYQLLKYLETGGTDSSIRPWVWISWLFLGPFIGSLAIQWYVFIATSVLVRLEAVLVQLVFEHSLRIRVKAETEPSSTESSVASTALTTPDSGSVFDEETESRGTPASTDSGTLHVSGASVSSKGKGDVSDTPASSPTSSNLVGKINNLVTTDLGNITEARDFLCIVLWTPLTIVLCIWFLYTILGWSAFVGLAVIIAMMPASGFLAKLVKDVQETRMKRTDARVQYVTEAMNVLRMIKLFGWEERMKDRIAVKRDDELIWTRYKQFLDLLIGTLNYIIPVITMIVTYTTYLTLINFSKTIVMKESLSASKVFSSMSVFDLLREHLHMVFRTLSETMTGKVSLDRMNDFLHNTELLDKHTGEKEYVFEHESIADPTVIGFHHSTFSWSDDTHTGSLTPSKRKFRLRIEESLLFKAGRLNLIIGSTGSGKTSLLMALLGEMHFIPSSPVSWYNLPREGGVAYAAQESWVQNETIRDNIVFGSVFDEERYKKVLYQCSLERDLALFSAGDLTEVGEKGLTLSGGQKARVTLARAIYSHANIILLDDVLAALDVHTAKWIVDKCFKGDLVKDRTIILVTHNVAMVQSISSFVVSIKDGRVYSQGSAVEVLAKDRFMAAEVEKEQHALEKAEQEHTVDAQPPLEDTKSDGKLIVAEEIEEGHISWPALKLYLSGLASGHPILFFSFWLGGYFITEIGSAARTWYLGIWGEQYEYHDPADVPVFYYLGIYISLIIATVTAYTIGYSIYVFGAVRAARSIHKKLMDSVLGTTLRWLDTTPTSRVIARCTQDIRAVDGPISMWLCILVEISVIMLIKLVAVVAITPIFLIPGIVVFLLGGILGQIYMKAQLSVKREMSNAKSPILAHIGASLSGLTSIRAYGVEERFKAQSITRINKYTRAARTFYNLNRWICIRIDVLGGLFAAALAWYLVYFQDRQAATTGFSLNMAVGFSSMILWWVRTLNEFEIQGNSLERIEQFVTIEQEPQPTERGTPPAYWPASGSIKATNLSARYSRDGPKVLHNLNFSIDAGQRIGVVGRTGSGKSSLTLSLLRCIFTEGEVYFDGIATSSINLDALRSSITIIPQVPELLSGTLRQNLDPFDQYEDAILNDALRSAGLFSVQGATDDGRLTLDSSIASGGGNLSIGQRQILALARAIVRGSKLLILDEATSAIDFQTDNVIQSSLRSELGRDVTLITVAHRLQTIMDADKIMVLDSGRIVEFDSPKELLKIKGGKLRALVDESADRDILHKMAHGERESPQI